ncbi:MAG: hypothetical protein AAB815_02900 [Patescibacteria group bacterium]|mgnify:CR=1 FL=1
MILGFFIDMVRKLCLNLNRHRSPTLTQKNVKTVILAGLASGATGMALVLALAIYGVEAVLEAVAPVVLGVGYMWLLWLMKEAFAAHSFRQQNGWKVRLRTLLITPGWYW